MKRWTAVVIALAVVLTAAANAQTGTRQRRPTAQEYGRVVIDNFSKGAGLAAVEFDHWLHRAKFTCRLCHVDLGFAMKADQTRIRAEDNRNGEYCGACHDGRRRDGDRVVFAACDTSAPPAGPAPCERCHSRGLKVPRLYDFATFTAKLPRQRFGNGVAWETAEEQGLIAPQNHLEGVSIRRRPIAMPKDFRLTPKVDGMPQIIFSHDKHTAWNGCELCHPEIFIGVKKGATTYSMIENFDGKYCGACHKSVAFPLSDCQRCHSRPVE